MGTNLRGTLDTIPKPRFLASIEKYLYDELKILGVEDVIANESRLQVTSILRLLDSQSIFFNLSQVFREVFATIIDGFKTYKPLLSSIKNEYEIMLIHLQDKIRELEPLRVSDGEDLNLDEHPSLSATIGFAQ